MLWPVSCLPSSPRPCSGHMFPCPCSTPGRAVLRPPALSARPSETHTGHPRARVWTPEPGQPGFTPSSSVAVCVAVRKGLDLCPQVQLLRLDWVGRAEFGAVPGPWPLLRRHLRAVPHAPSRVPPALGAPLPLSAPTPSIRGPAANAVGCDFPACPLVRLLSPGGSLGLGSSGLPMARTTGLPHKPLSSLQPARLGLFM